MHHGRELFRIAKRCQGTEMLAVIRREGPASAPQNRCALSRIISNTAATSPGERLMESSTSASAVSQASAPSRSVVLLSSFRCALSRSSLHSARSPRRSAMICCGSANELSGVGLIRGPHRGRPSGRIIPCGARTKTDCRSGRSLYPRRMTATGRAPSILLVRRTAPIGASRPLPRVRAKVP